MTKKQYPYRYPLTSIAGKKNICFLAADSLVGAMEPCAIAGWICTNDGTLLHGFSYLLPAVQTLPETKRRSYRDEQGKLAEPTAIKDARHDIRELFRLFQVDHLFLADVGQYILCEPVLSSVYYHSRNNVPCWYLMRRRTHLLTDHLPKELQDKTLAEIRDLCGMERQSPKTPKGTAALLRNTVVFLANHDITQLLHPQDPP